MDLGSHGGNSMRIDRNEGKGIYTRAGAGISEKLVEFASQCDSKTAHLHSLGIRVKGVSPVQVDDLRLGRDQHLTF